MLTVATVLVTLIVVAAAVIGLGALAPGIIAAFSH